MSGRVRSLQWTMSGKDRGSARVGEFPPVSVSSGGAEQAGFSLFQPNNLSRTRPEFALLTAASEREIVQSVLSGCYGVEATAVDLLIGANAASRNYRATTSHEVLFIKSAFGEINQSRLAQEGRRAEALRGEGIATPRIIRALGGQIAVAEAGRAWLVSAYESGDHFQGRGRELDSAGEAFARLAQAAIRIEAAGSLIAAQPPEVELHEVIPLAEEAAASRHDESVVALCEAHLPLISSALARVPADLRLLGPVRPLHLDYHPLNLLMRDEEVAVVLDLADILNYPAAAGLGFAGFKLIRQMMVDPELRRVEERNSSAVSRWIEAWNGAFPEDAFTSDILAAGARYRVLTLIRLILDRLVRYGDSSLTYDLEKHIVSLVEIDWIFEGVR